MTVAELIMWLSNLPADMKVITQKDDEGNGYRKANGVELVYVEDSRAHEIEILELEDGDDPREFDEVVVIW